MGRAEAREAGPLPKGKEERRMLVVYGIDEESETITPLTHLALLTSEEARKVELWDFFQSPEEDAPAPFNDRLVVLTGFEDIARHRGETAAEHLGRELIGNFSDGQLRPVLPLPSPAPGGLRGKRAGRAPTGPGTGERSGRWTWSRTSPAPWGWS
jgi:hypothetical protein